MFVQQTPNACNPTFALRESKLDTAVFNYPTNKIIWENESLKTGYLEFDTTTTYSTKYYLEGIYTQNRVECDSVTRNVLTINVEVCNSPNLV